MAEEIRDVVIMGSGCSGLTAAIYTGRANLKPLVLEGHEPGGQLSMTTLVENFPGWPEGINGPELIENMRKQAERFGAEFRIGHVSKADLSQRPFVLTVGQEQIKTRALIIASGASARWLGLPSEKALIGHGVSSLRHLRRIFLQRQGDRRHRRRRLGHGRGAVPDALRQPVTLIHRRESFRASKIMLERARTHGKIHFLTNTVVDEVLDVAAKEVTGLKLRNLVTGKSVDAAGQRHVPGHWTRAQRHAFAGPLRPTRRLPEGARLGAHRRAGVYACGDVADRRYRQAITAAGTGCMAAIEVEKFLEESGR